MVPLLIYSAKKIWEAVRELPHFIYWIIMFVLDRNPGEYVLVDEAKRREEAKKQWEASPEYATKQKNLRIIEDFYNNGIVAPELYCLLGREEGYMEGAAEGFKSTYDAAFHQGQLKAIADAAARAARSSGGSSYTKKEKSDYEKDAEARQQYTHDLIWRQSQERDMESMRNTW